MRFLSFVSDLKADAAFHYRSPSSISQLARSLLNPSLIAVTFARLCTVGPKFSRKLFRAFLLSQFACDVSPRARLGVPLEFPHPIGIVIGDGVQVGGRARIFQNVTLGSSRGGRYPMLREDVTVYAGAVIAGGAEIGRGVVVGANTVVTRSVPAGSVIKAGPTSSV